MREGEIEGTVASCTQTDDDKTHSYSLHDEEDAFHNVIHALRD